MTGFPPLVWICIALIALFGLLAMLYTLAATVRSEMYRHDVKVKTARMRLRFGGGGSSPQREEPLVVDEAPPEELRAAA